MLYKTSFTVWKDIHTQLTFGLVQVMHRKNGTAPINATITLNGNRASFSSNKKVNPSDWDATRQRVKGTNENAKLINESLLQIKNKIYKKEVELLERGYILTADLLRDAYQDKIDAIQTKTLNKSIRSS